jgi:Uma2 family endonuclease
VLAGRPDTATNPTVLIEVLSDATHAYDRGQKFAAYKSLPSLKEYVLIEQGRIGIEHWRRGREGSWVVRTVTRSTATLRLPALGLRFAVSEIYRGVELPAKRRS